MMAHQAPHLGTSLGVVSERAAARRSSLLVRLGLLGATPHQTPATLEAARFKIRQNSG
jgi:hypothetical protein